MQVTMTVSNLGKVTKDFTGYTRRLPKAGRRGMSLFTNHLASALRKELKAKGHSTSGYSSSERGTHSQKLDKDTWVIKMPFYINYLEKGTIPHWIPRVSKTKLWARKHGMSFPMMRAIISGKGTKAHPFSAQVLNREVQKLKDKVEKQINNSIKKAG